MTRRHLHAVPDIAEGAVLYIRQSMTRYERDAQGNKTKVLDTVSPELQETAGRDYCQRQGYRVVATVIDLNRTGRTLKRRKVQEAIGYLERGEATVIVVWKWSRLSRNRRDWAITSDHVEDKVGGRIESSTEPTDITTAVGRLNRGMLAEFAAFESDRAGEVWKEIADSRVARGLPASGRDRFGYLNTGKGRFEPHPELGEVLAQMYRRFIAGAGYKGVAKWLNAEGRRTVADGIWREGTVRSVLDSGFGAGKLRHRGELIDGAHAAVISEEEWAEYLAVRDERKTIPSRGKGSRYLLTTLVKCGICGAAMWARPDRSGVHWYRCRNRSLTGCLNPYVRATDIESEVLDWLRRIVGDIDRVAEAKRKTRAKVVNYTHRVESLERRIRQHDEALTRLTVDRAHGLVPDDAYQAARDEIATARERLRGELADALARTRANARVNVERYAGLLAEWDTIPVAARRDALREILARVRVWGKPLTVKPVPAWEDEAEPTTSDVPGIVTAPARPGVPSLTPEQAREVRRRYAAGGTSMNALAKEHGISESTVWHLIHGTTYRTVTD